MKQQRTRSDRIISRINNNPIVASLLVLGTIVIALSTFTNATKNLTKTLLALVSKPQPEAARLQLSQMSYEYTPAAFVESAKKGDVSAVKLLLVAGMDPNATDDEGNTAMMYAAREGYVEVINALLKAKANVNKKNEGGATALSLAAARGNKAALHLLLNNGADSEAINQAFADAAESGQLEALRILIDKGVDVSKVGPKAL